MSCFLKVGSVELSVDFHAGTIIKYELEHIFVALIGLILLKI